MPWPTCYCPKPPCSCGGSIHSYIESYKKILNEVKPKRVWEWGPGPNTSMALAIGAQVVSVEHQKRYAIPTIGNLISLVVGLDSKEYTSVMPVDLYFVDGRRRADCLTAIARISGAVVCLHDAQRVRYHDALRLFPDVIFMTKGFAVARNH
jgi:hypothetical protein